MAPSGVQERETGWILPEIQHALRTTHDAALRTTHDLLQRQAAAQRGGVQDTPSTMTWGHSLDDAGQFHMTSAPSLPDYVDQRMPHTTNTPESMNNRQKSTHMTQQTCGQRSSRTAESKGRALGNYFSERICYLFSISTCRGDGDLGLCPTSVLAFEQSQRNGQI